MALAVLIILHDGLWARGHVETWRGRLLSNRLFHLRDSSLPCPSTITGLSLLLLLLLFLVLVLVPHFLSPSTLPFLPLWTHLFLLSWSSVSSCSHLFPQRCSSFCSRGFGGTLGLGHPCPVPLLGANADKHCRLSTQHGQEEASYK